METPRQKQRNLYLQNLQQNSTPLRIPPSPFMKSLGYGTGVNVYRLDRSPKHGQNLSPWAVKRVSRVTRANNLGVFNARIQEEAAILRKLSHPNIIGFRRIVKADGDYESLAMECCQTSLGHILEERMEEDKGALPAEKILKMVSDISKALDYLHTEAKLLHGDLKSYNVLVNGEFEICKLCDFGVSLPLDDDGMINFKKNPSLCYVGTACWCAPEIIDGDDIIDSKADIFSFGLVIYETIALCPPHTLDANGDDKENTAESSIALLKDDSLNNEDGAAGSFKNTSIEDSFNNTTETEASSVIEQMEQVYGTRPPLPQAFELNDKYNIVLELFYCCTSSLPEDRPTAKTIWTSLQ